MHILGLHWAVWAVLLGPPLALGIYIAWLVVPQVVRAVVPAVVQVVNEDLNRRKQ